ncbi:MAG: Rrf2 family transcriptional regulator [Armatimonadetes bacterium]|nr:Rrf2 family transcriptional regulator [Armatimonadota bacterium]
MKLSAQEEYGLRCLVSLARQGEGGTMTIPEISRAEGLSQSHVAKLLAILRKAGVISATRGQVGGYRLARPAGQIALRDILQPLGGTLFGPEFCARHTGLEADCVHKTDCALRPLWTNLEAVVNSVIDRYTLGDLVDGNIEQPLVHLGQVHDRHHAEAR